MKTTEIPSQWSDAFSPKPDDGRPSMPDLCSAVAEFRVPLIAARRPAARAEGRVLAFVADTGKRNAGAAAGALCVRAQDDPVLTPVPRIERLTSAGVSDDAGWLSEAIQPSMIPATTSIRPSAETPSAATFISTTFCKAARIASSASPDFRAASARITQ